MAKNKITKSNKHLSQRSISLNMKEIRITSPIPPPEIMQEYELIMPNAMKMFLDRSEAQLKHRQKIEEIEVKEQNHRANVGVLTGWFSILFFGAIGGVLLYFDKNVGGYSFFVGAFLPRILSFLYSIMYRRKEIEENK